MKSKRIDVCLLYQCYGAIPKVQALGNAPNQRFCHVACVHKNSMFIFGGYDGTSRLNDLMEFRLLLRRFSFMGGEKGG